MLYQFLNEECENNLLSIKNLTTFALRFLNDGLLKMEERFFKRILRKKSKQKFGWNCKEPVSLQSAKKISKTVLFLISIYSGFIEWLDVKKLKIKKINLAEIKKAGIFALPNKKRVAETAKRSLKVWKQQQVNLLDLRIR